MVHLLVYTSRIFRPASLDYAKALRSLLSYPPHLANLDAVGWKMLMSICWAAVLDDPVTLDDEWDDTSKFGSAALELDDDDEDEVARNANGTKVVSSTVELVTLIPILLSSPAAPLIPPLPSRNEDGYHHQHSLGYSVTEKIRRFLSQRRTNESVDLNVLRSLNIVLEQLELNCRRDFVAAGTNLYPQLAALWETGSRPVREQVLIALRFFLNFCQSPGDFTATGIWIDQSSFVPALERIMEYLPREGGSRWGISPLDINAVRLSLNTRADALREPFATDAASAGLGFSHDQAMSWVAMDLYGDTCTKLHEWTTAPTPETNDSGTMRKRRKRADALESTLRGCEMGSARSRLYHLQVCLFLVVRHWSRLPNDGQRRISDLCLNLLEDAEPSIQDWAFITLTSIASQNSTATTSPAIPSTTSDTPWHRAWSHCVRKAFGPHGRAASHLACAILVHRLLSSSIFIEDIETLLHNVDIQGPLTPYDSVCELMRLALCQVRSDVRLYSAGLESKVMSWIGKWSLTDSSTKMRLKQHGPADLLALMVEACGMRHFELPSMSSIDNLPDCAVVTRLLTEHATQPIRLYGLKGHITSLKSSSAADKAEPIVVDEPKPLEGLSRSATAALYQHIEHVLVEWTTPAKADRIRDASPTLSPDKMRRGIDVVLLALSFQLTLSLNGIQMDDPSLDILAEAISKLSTMLWSKVHDAPALHLMWSALRSILPSSREHSSSVWPVMLQSNANSGVRQDILPQLHSNDAAAVSILQKAVWSLPKVCYRPLSNSVDHLLAERIFESYFVVDPGRPLI